MNYILDTNIISALMKGNDELKRKLQVVSLRGDEVFINGISYYEIKRGLLSANVPEKFKIFDKTCKQLKIILLDRKYIFDKASEIWAFLKGIGRLIPDADILIAAMVLAKGSVLVSDNTSHFQTIKELPLKNWLREEL
jgi:tRNA(fMet)-specific endonuclease VapC